MTGGDAQGDTDRTDSDTYLGDFVVTAEDDDGTFLGQTMLGGLLGAVRVVVLRLWTRASIDLVIVG